MVSSSLPNDPRYFPMLLTESTDVDRAAALMNTWNRYKELPQEIRDVLMSDELSQKLKLLQDTLHLEIDTIGKISLVVRKLFFGEFEVSELAEKVSVLVSDDSQQVQRITEFIQNEILTIKPAPRVNEEDVVEEESKRVAPVVHLPLLQALSEYEQLGNQLITRERIRVKSQPEPVRPSLLYWIKYYRDELGIGHHDTVQRGNFLFRSDNGKRLSPEERERVSLVLKSVEENMPLDIDTERNEIIFPPLVTQSEKPVLPRPTFAMPPIKASFRQDVPSEPREVAQGEGVGGGTLSFSSKHVLGAEMSEHTAQTKERSIPERVTPPAPAPRANPFHIRPVSLGKEEE